jgi:hypothetical protein
MSPHDLSKTHDAYLMRYACRIYDGSTKGYGIPDGRALAGRQKNANNQKEVHSVNVLVLTIMVLGLSVPEAICLGALKPLIPRFISYALSFIYVAFIGTITTFCSKPLKM